MKKSLTKEKKDLKTELFGCLDYHNDENEKPSRLWEIVSETIDNDDDNN